MEQVIMTIKRSYKDRSITEFNEYSDESIRHFIQVLKQWRDLEKWHIVLIVVLKNLNVNVMELMDYIIKNVIVKNMRTLKNDKSTRYTNNRRNGKTG